MTHLQAPQRRKEPGELLGSSPGGRCVLGMRTFKCEWGSCLTPPGQQVAQPEVEVPIGAIYTRGPPALAPRPSVGRWNAPPVPCRRCAGCEGRPAGTQTLPSAAPAWPPHPASGVPMRAMGQQAGLPERPRWCLQASSPGLLGARTTALCSGPPVTARPGREGNPVCAARVPRISVQTATSPVYVATGDGRLPHGTGPVWAQKRQATFSKSHR